jgi:hypothetical protein
LELRIARSSFPPREAAAALPPAARRALFFMARLKRRTKSSNGEVGSARRTAPVPRGVIVSTRRSKRFIEMDLLKSYGGLPPLVASRAVASRIAENMVDDNGFVKDDEVWTLLDGRFFHSLYIKMH